MEKYPIEVHQSIVDMLINTELSNVEIAKLNKVSVSLVDSINACKHREANKLHSYSKNIRREKHGWAKNVKNEYIETASYVILRITNTRGRTIETIIDKEDAERVKEHSWNFREQEKVGEGIVYGVRTAIKGKHMPLHHFVFKRPSAGKVIDHRDRNPLNNRKSNLREVTCSINSGNAQPRKESSSRVRGVYRRNARPGQARECWTVEWSIDGKRRSNSFSIAKYGEIGAFNKALEVRKQKEKEIGINKIGVDF